MFILMYVLSYVGSANLLRHAEGATWLAIVVSLVTPLGFLFWTLFSESPFKWHPRADVKTWFSIGALAIMVPAIFIYNWGAPEVTLSNENDGSGDFRYSDSGDGYDSRSSSSKDPLLIHPSQTSNSVLHEDPSFTR